MSGALRTMSRREALHDWERPAEEYVWLVNWPAYSLPYCSLYVIAPDGHWPSKVGISTRPEKRVQELQTAHWKALSVAQCFWTPNIRDARCLESKIHETLAGDGAYLLGEWFDKSAKETVDIIKFCALVVGVEINETVSEPEVLEDLSRRVQAERSRYNSVRAQTLTGGKQAKGPVINSQTGRVLT